MFRDIGTSAPPNVPGNVPAKTLETQAFFDRWNIGTFIFY